MKNFSRYIYFFFVIFTPLTVIAHEDIDGSTTIYNFDLTGVAQVPDEFINISGKWEVKNSGNSVSKPNILAHEIVSHETEHPMHFLDISGPFKDITHATVQIRFPEKDHQGYGGFYCLYKNNSTYQAIRINLKSNQLEFMESSNGKKRMISKNPIQGLVTDWHRLTMEIKQDEFRILWDLEPIYSNKVANIVLSAVGLMASSETEVQFDDMVIIQKTIPHNH